jgi:glutamate formiminotransferase
MFDFHAAAALIKTAADLHDASRAVHGHHRRAGVLDVLQFALE